MFKYDKRFAFNDERSRTDCELDGGPCTDNSHSVNFKEILPKLLLGEVIHTEEIVCYLPTSLGEPPNMSKGLMLP